MTRVFSLMSLTILGLTACGPAPRGVGFTGVGAEPVGISAAVPSEDTRLSPAQNLQKGGTLPLHRLNTTSTGQSVLAAQAQAVGRARSRATNAIKLAGQTVMVSLVEGGGELFLVARVPKPGSSQSLAPGTDRALLGAVPLLTGCRHQGKVYRAGVSQTQPSSLATPLSCG